jgi:trans-2-enoyl-CoA reductase
MKLLMKKSTLISLLFVAVSAISFSYVGSQVTHQLDGSIAAAPNDLAVSRGFSSLV